MHPPGGSPGPEDPDIDAQCFDVLASASILSTELAERLGRMARFRNLLVHGYADVDDGRVWEIMKSDLGDLDEYLSAISHSLRESLS